MPFLISAWAFTKKIPGEVWVVVLLVLAALGVGIYIDRKAVKRTNDKRDAEQLRDGIVLQETAKEIVNEVQDRIANTEEALARYPYLRSRDELRQWDKDVADLVDPDSAGHER